MSSRTVQIMSAMCVVVLLCGDVKGMMHPTMGRFMQRDPLGYVDGMGLYVYAMGNAVRLLDPFGLASYHHGSLKNPDVDYLEQGYTGVCGNTVYDPSEQECIDGKIVSRPNRGRPGYAPMGRAAKPTTQCKLDGKLLTLLFDGVALAGGDKSWLAASGKPVQVTQTWTLEPEKWQTRLVKTYEFDYTDDRQKIRNEGPIPAGKYWLDICEESSAGGASFRRQSFRHWFATDAWGSFSVPLHAEPDTETHGRGGFFIHGGANWGSAGCIDIKGSDAEMDRLFEAAYKNNSCNCCYVTVEVKYTKGKHARTEESVEHWTTHP